MVKNAKAKDCMKDKTPYNAYQVMAIKVGKTSKNKKKK
jgi:hypothetical protein